MNCEKCGEECYRDEVDVGVGVICGPYGCPGCGWSEDPQYDCSNGPSPQEQENPDWMVDPFGGMIRKSAVDEKLEHFGIQLHKDKVGDRMEPCKACDGCGCYSDETAPFPDARMCEECGGWGKVTATA